MAKPMSSVDYRQLDYPQPQQGMTRTTLKRKLRRYHRFNARRMLRLVSIFDGTPSPQPTYSAWHLRQARRI